MQIVAACEGDLNIVAAQIHKQLSLHKSKSTHVCGRVFETMEDADS